MRNIIMALALAALAPSAYAATDIVEMPMLGFGSPESVSVSTYAYTNVTSTGVRIGYMSALLISNPPTNTAGMWGHIGDCTSTSVSTSTIKGPIQIAPSAGSGSISISGEHCLWLMSRHTSAESVIVQGVKQRRD